MSSRWRMNQAPGKKMRPLRRFAWRVLCGAPLGVLAFILGIPPAFVTQEGGHENLLPLVYVLWGPARLIPYGHREWWNMTLANALGYGLGGAALLTLWRGVRGQPPKPDSPTRDPS